MEEMKSKWGGSRPNSGRPKGDRPNKILISLSDESMARLKNVKNRSELIDNLIRNGV